MTGDDEPKPPSDETIFERAIVLEESTAREEYLRSACRGDVGQRERIECLIRADERAEELMFLESKRDTETQVAGARPDSSGGRPKAVSAEPGDMIGQFKLLRQIGQGGMGIVWLAGQVEPIKREVALKIVSPGLDSKAISDRFETERRALALMEHPHIARFLDAGVTGSGRPFFAMEFVDGLQITTFCDRKILTVDQRLRLMVQVCRAVQHAHQKGVLHRDLKPSNILVTSQDGKPVPKVIDFGIAKALGEDADHLGQTMGKQFLGTPAYMSPEQAGIAKDIDARADIFSLGAVLFELLTGTAPIEPEQLRGASFEQVLSLVRDAEPASPSKRIVAQGEALHDIAVHRRTEPGLLARKLRGDLDWIVDRAMSKERGRRYESAEELAKDLERHLADEPVVAGPPGRIYRARKFVRRYRGLVVASSSAAAALVVAFATSAFMYVRAEVARHDQSVVTQKVSDERAKKEQAQIEGFDLTSLRNARSIPLRAIASDDVGVVNVSLLYRTVGQANSETRRIILYDDGMHDDGKIVDGYFANLLPALQSGEAIQYYFEATDLSGKVVTIPDDPRFVEGGEAVEMYSLGIAGSDPLRITEVVADNENGIRDEGGGTPDYIEILNTSNEPLSLDGVSVARSLRSGAEEVFTFPTGTTLDPGEFIIAFADANVTQGDLHAPFRIDSTSDRIVLFRSGADGVRRYIDGIDTRSVGQDEAVFRAPGTDELWLTGTPSPYADGIGGNQVGLGTDLVGEIVLYYTFTTEPGITYVPEFSHSLAPGSWQVLPAVSGDGTVKTASKELIGKNGFLRIRPRPTQ